MVNNSFCFDSYTTSNCVGFIASIVIIIIIVIIMIIIIVTIIIVMIIFSCHQSYTFIVLNK